MVLPPVGNAEAAIQLVECLEQYTETEIFGNDDFHMQVCTPGRLDQRRAALLAATFYLGSDTIRRYNLENFDTTVSNDYWYRRGLRPVLYDAGGSGTFEKNFAWWHRTWLANELSKKARLPFHGVRTDVMVGVASRTDIRVVNLAASLLVHAQFKSYRGWWHQVGLEFEEELVKILDDHLLTGILDAEWVTNVGERNPDEDESFAKALWELVSCSLSENDRLSKYYSSLELFMRVGFSPDPLEMGIFESVEDVLKKYRERISPEEKRSST
jgi:hypothetical protein